MRCAAEKALRPFELLSHRAALNPTNRWHGVPLTVVSTGGGVLDRWLQVVWQGRRYASIARFGFRCVAVGTAIALAPLQIAHAQSNSKGPAIGNVDRDTIDKARAAALEHMRAGRFAAGVPFARIALALTEASHGPEATETAIASHSLAFLLRRTNQPQEARALLERALSIYQRRLPAIHEDIRNAVGELGQIYVAEGRGAEVVALYAGLIERASREGHGGHVAVGHLNTNLGFVLRGLGRAAESEQAFRQAVTLYEANDALDGDPYRLALETLLDRLEAGGRFEQSITMAKAAIERLVARAGKVSDLVIRLHNRLSGQQLEAGRFVEARAHAQAALELISRTEAPPQTAARPVATGAATGVDQTVAALNNLARAYRAVAEYPAAEQAYRRAIARLGVRNDKANAGILIDNLAVLYLHQGRLDEAERHHKQALALLEEALGREDASVGRAAANLGTLLNESGRPGEAEPLLRRALAIANARSPRDPVSIGVIADNLAGLLRTTNRHQEARGLYSQALALFEGALPPKHPRLATARNNLGRFFLDIGSYAEAEAELKRALAISVDIYGAQSAENAFAMGNLAEVYAATRRYDEARAHFARALALLEATHGSSHYNLLLTLSAAAQLELADGKPLAARSLFERAVAIEVATRARRGLRNNSIARSRAGREPFIGLVEAIWRSGTEPATRDTARALEVGQWDTMTPAAAALAAFGARAGTGDATLQAAVRERQDLAADWQVVDRRLTEQLSQSGQRNVALEGDLRQRLAAIEARLDAIDSDLAARFPRYHDLARPAPIGIAEVQALLSPDETAIQFVVATDATYVWAVSKSSVAWHRAPIKERELRSLVRTLRCGLDETEWFGEGTDRCTKLLGLAPEQIPPQGEPLPFDPVSAHNLFKILLGPLSHEIAGKDLLVVASGPLTALPFQVLVTEPPPPREASGSGKADFAGVAWLGHRNAITVLPSLASLSSLRQLARSSRAAKSYVGVGNPLLTGADGTDRRAFDVPGCEITPAANSRIASGTVKPASQVLRGAGVNLDALRRQSPLPETVDELCRVARFLGASPEDVVVGARATETSIKEMSSAGRLADARIVHFATHGLLAGETAQFLTGKAEPALVMTPPAKSNDTDDGLLTASEVANLKLDADWVVLSACNTAGGEEVGAEALSGLARAFFYAGARSLLVSHWAVDSDATVKLITAAFREMARDPDLTQSRALARAMAAMATEGGRSTHPSYWSPFVVVGGSAPQVRAPPASVAVEDVAKPPPALPTKSIAPAKAGPARPKGTSTNSAGDDWQGRALGLER